MFRNARRAVSLAAGLATAIAAGTGAGPRVSSPAWGQACCASAGLIAPTRLRSYEDYAVGLQARGRSVLGSFDAASGYRGSDVGEREWGLQQDFFAVARVSARGQVALVLPFVQTHRALPGVSETGGGLGDVSISARYDFITAGERRIVPGLALLIGVMAPTGTPPESAGDLLSTGSTGQGSWEGTLGIGMEQAFEPYFAQGSFTVGLRSPRTFGGTRESFAPRFTATLVAGRVFSHGISLGAFVAGVRQGENLDARGPIPDSDSLSMTAGAAFALSPSDHWRLQGTLFGNPPASGLGRNQTAGMGASLSVIRLWL